MVPREREDGRVRHPIGRITFLALKEVSEQVVLNLYRASTSECLAQCWSWRNEVPEKSGACHTAISKAQPSKHSIVPATSTSIVSAGRYRDNNLKIRAFFDLRQDR